MKLHILSDLHIDFAPFNPPQTEADVIVLAGDIHLGSNGFKWAREKFSDKPVIYDAKLWIDGHIHTHQNYRRLLCIHLQIERNVLYYSLWD